MLDRLQEQNDLLTEQNRALKDMISEIRNAVDEGWETSDEAEVILQYVAAILDGEDAS